MITNEKQYRSTRALIDRLKVSRAALDNGAASDVHPVLRSAQRSALESQVSELEEDVALYDHLRSGAVTVFEAQGLHDLPDILIKARIARGMSQRDLAEFLGLKEQQIQRYEAERYRSASLDRLIEIAEGLHIKLREIGELRGDGRLESVDSASFNAFPIAEMYKRGWFEDFSGTLPQARKAAATLIPAFVRAAGGNWTGSALHRKSVRAGGQVHEAAIAAWEARVLSLADRDPPSVCFDRRMIDDAWVKALTVLSAKDDGPRLARSHLREIGIMLVIEPHLPGTLLDGAGILSSHDVAIVALTLRHDRLDNFWFTLLHEVGHLALHLGSGQFRAIFDDTEAPAGSEIEEQADLFAQEALLPTAQWKTSLSRFSRTERSVRADAAKFGIHPAILAGRIRREAHDYTLLRSLVGAGDVRVQFGQ
jgi:HTH-type transcriptional regulator/antitoxin HigA